VVIGLIGGSSPISYRALGGGSSIIGGVSLSEVPINIFSDLL
jgi:hypothetical protein